MKVRTEKEESEGESLSERAKWLRAVAAVLAGLATLLLAIKQFFE